MKLGLILVLFGDFFLEQKMFVDLNSRQMIKKVEEFGFPGSGKKEAKERWNYCQTYGDDTPIGLSFSRKDKKNLKSLRSK